MTVQHEDHDGPIIPKPALTLRALRGAVAKVAPSRLVEFFEGMETAFVHAGEDNNVFPIRAFYLKWAVIVEIERHPETARRLHAAELALNSDDPETREQAIRDAGDIVRAAHDEVEGG